MNIVALQGALELGLIYSLVSLGLYLSYRILNIADLTVDGSFTLGAAVAAIFATIGHPFIGTLLAMVAGGAAGCVTAFLQTKLKVQSILAGIITMTALYSINLIVMGNRSNVPLNKTDTIYTFFDGLLPSALQKFIIVGVVIILIGIFLIYFLKTTLGLSIRATGDNRDMVSSSSINPAFTTAVGLCLANAIVGLSGALLAQYQSFTEINVGTGMVIVGLASLIIGEAIVGRGGVIRCVLGAIIGSIIYRLIIAVALNAAISPSNLKLVSAVIVAAAISYPAIKEKIQLARLKKAGGKNVDHR